MLNSTHNAYTPMETGSRRVHPGAQGQEDTIISVSVDTSADRVTDAAQDVPTLPTAKARKHSGTDPMDAKLRIAYAPGKSDYREVWRKSLDSAKSLCLPVAMGSLCLAHLTLVLTHLTGCSQTPKEEDRHSGIVQTSLVVAGSMVVGPIVTGSAGLVKNVICEISNTHDCNQLKLEILRSIEELKKRDGWNPAFPVLMAELPRAWKGEKNARFLEGLLQLTRAMERSQELAEFVFVSADAHLSLNEAHDPSAQHDRRAELARAFSIEVFDVALKTEAESVAPGSQRRREYERQQAVMQSFNEYWEDEPSAVPHRNAQAQLYQALCAARALQFFRVPDSGLDDEPMSPRQLDLAVSGVRQRFDQICLDIANAEADADELS